METLAERVENDINEVKDGLPDVKESEEMREIDLAISPPEVIEMSMRAADINKEMKSNKADLFIEIERHKELKKSLEAKIESQVNEISKILDQVKSGKRKSVEKVTKKILYSEHKVQYYFGDVMVEERPIQLDELQLTLIEPNVVPINDSKSIAEGIDPSDFDKEEIPSE